MSLTTIVPPNFIEAPVFADEWKFGATTGLTEKPVNTTGNWCAYAPAFEKQYRNVESMSCVTYAILNAIEILYLYQFQEVKNFSERYTSTLAGTTKQGNTPHKVLETIRRNGLIDEALLPFTDEITTWEAYFAPIAKEMRKIGKRWLRSYIVQHDWVFVAEDPLELKHSRLKAALVHSPIPVTVEAWHQKDDLYWTRGGRDNHMCLVIGYDDESWYVLDSYAPFIKRLDKGYKFGYAKRVVLKRQGIFSFFL